MRRRRGSLTTALIATILMLTGCSRAVDGDPVAAPPTDDAARFFEGPVPTYGFDLTDDEIDTLAYQQAVRRIDPCGFADEDRFAAAGEIVAKGPLVSFDECGIELRIPGERATVFVGVGLVFTNLDGPVAFRTGGIEVYETYPGECLFEMPIALSDLPDAPAAPLWSEPVVRVDGYHEADCRVMRLVAEAVAPKVAELELTLRDGASAYPVALAESDPCAVLDVVSADYWDATYDNPYECAFTVDGQESMNWVSLQPRLFDEDDEYLERRDRDGIEILFDEDFCAADAFVGERMLPRTFDGNTASMGRTIVRPAVTVESGPWDCDDAIDLAVQAAQLYT